MIALARSGVAIRFHDLPRIEKVEWLFHKTIVSENKIAQRAFRPYFNVTLEGIRQAEGALGRLRILRHRAIHLALTLRELEFQAANRRVVS